MLIKQILGVCKQKSVYTIVYYQTDIFFEIVEK